MLLTSLKFLALQFNLLSMQLWNKLKLNKEELLIKKVDLSEEPLTEKCIKLNTTENLIWLEEPLKEKDKSPETLEEEFKILLDVQAQIENLAAENQNSTMLEEVK